MSVTSEHTIDAILTNRELEVLALVAAGLSAKEIAQRISIAPRTVERHVENARLKMHARNRTHLVTCALIHGLLNASLQAELFLNSPYPGLAKAPPCLKGGQFATSI
ncbi:MAG TPA: helix-turn-helix transcriptional regulator [Sphingobium sp.]